MDAGADAYIVKGTFDQAGIIDHHRTVDRIIRIMVRVKH